MTYLEGRESNCGRLRRAGQDENEYGPVAALSGNEKLPSAVKANGKAKAGAAKKK